MIIFLNYNSNYYIEFKKKNTAWNVLKLKDSVLFDAIRNLLSSSVVTIIGLLAFPFPFTVDAETQML